MTRKIKGKEVRVMTSMTYPLRFPAADIVNIYGYRWELWGLLAYNLIRFQMA